MRRLVQMVSAAVVGMVVMAAPGASQESAASIVEVGWWTSNRAAISPDKGLNVSAGPTGAISVAAIRIAVSTDSISSASLSLKEDGGVQQAGAPLQVCPTPNAWAAGPAQPFEKAPRPECEQAKVPLTRGSDGVWTADVRAMLRSNAPDGQISLMVVPAVASAVVPFEVRFAPPKLTAVATSSATSSASSGTDDAPVAESTQSSPPTSSPPPRSSSFEDDPPSFPTSRSVADPAPTFPSFSNPELPSPSDGRTTAASPVDVAPPAAVGSPPVLRALPLSKTRGSRGPQALFFVVVATIVGLGAGVGHARFAQAGAGSTV